MPEFTDDVLTGYLSVDLNPDGDFGFGVSFYSSVWALVGSPVATLQVGLPSTWIKPDNRDFTIPLCPKGTYARDLADEGDAGWAPRGPSFRDVFQTIEGGVGYWGNTHFPSWAPKYRILGIPSCYTFTIGSPGWPFGGEPKVLDDADMGLVQLSNHVLIPPDGIPFEPQTIPIPSEPKTEGKLLGTAWMALPFTDFNGYFRLQTHDSEGRCLERTSNGGRLSAIVEKSNDQLWRIVPSKQKGYFHLEVRNELEPVNFGGGDLWKLVPATGEYYYLHTSKDKNKFLGGTDVVGMAGRSKNAPGTQLWKIVPQVYGNDHEVATGDSGWTLFLNAENFKGPLAFFPPTTWSRISRRNLPAVGRGLDSRMARMDQGAMEFGVLPCFEAKEKGKTYLRIPKLQFPTEMRTIGGVSTLVTVLMQDVKAYSREAIYAPVMSWFANGPAASGEFNEKGAKANKVTSAASIDFKQNGKTAVNLSEVVEVVDLSDKSCSWGLRWKDDPSRELIKGEFPEYYEDQNPVRNSKIPLSTGLIHAKFPKQLTGASYTSPLSKETPPGTYSNDWGTPGPVSRNVETINFSDGSQVDYLWYRFVDQPALQNLHLTEEQKDELQSRVVLLHKKWSSNGKFMKPPSTGKLVSLDSKLFVKPPKEFEHGYVPIVITQRLAPT